MANRIPWDLREAAILLQGLLDIRANKAPRAETIEIISSRLRSLAVQNGHKVDEKFRNINGISLQMSHLEYALTNGKTGLGPAHKWQYNIIEIFRNDPERYKEMLEEVNIVSESIIDTRSDFIAWLDRNMSAEKSEQITNSISTADLLLRKSGEIKRSVLDINALSTIDKLVARIKTKKIIHSRQLSTRVLAYVLAVRDYKGKSVQNYSSSHNQKNEDNKKVVYKKSDGNVDDFFQWMLHEKKLAESTCRSYVSNIYSAEKYAQTHNLASTKLFFASLEEASNTTDALYSDSDFAAYDLDQHNRFRAAITKLLEFLGGKLEKAPSEIVNTRGNERSEVDTDPFKFVLKKHFNNGFRIGSAIDIRKFRRYYEEDNEKSLSLDNDQLDRIIRSCGIEHEGRIYLPDVLLSENLRTRLFDYIKHCFSGGATAVYYEALFQHFHDDFLDYGIYDAEMLKSYIAYYAGDNYALERSYLSKDHLGETDPTTEIRELLKNHVLPMKITDIAKTLPHIPEENIRSILGTNLEFVRASKGVYFHADCFEVSDEELDDIADFIQDELNRNGYLSGNELYSNIKRLFPYVYEKNEAFPMIGFRDTLKYKLRDRFSFNGNIISSRENALSMSDVFSLYGKNRQSFTLADVLALVSDIGSKVIYFDSLYEYATRISETNFVRKDYVSYQTKETDRVLNRFCPGAYVPISEIDNFGLFPDASYPWNQYLLENYLAFHSELFELMHTGYNNNCVVGAMVRKSSGIQNYDDLITRVIADADVPLKKSDALSFLYEQGYIGRRTYKGIEALLIKAREIRNRKEQ
ncbi:hypothetical protein [Clostridium vitabionis]|uniref:hypothetical protein n=1 Tax=Clostridium vitabionis TaxID=2784388 RepID=UPI00188D2423|nr:hypothetical protein [Clostridium vitabionis]